MIESAKEHSILLVDDHALFRGGLRLLLDAHPRFCVYNEASTGVEMLDVLRRAYARGEMPAVVLLDISMPEMNGIEAAERALEIYNDLKIITLSMYGEEDYYFRMVTLGVKGFLLKNSDVSEVYAALESVIDGGSYFSQELLFNLVSNLRSNPTGEDETEQPAIVLSQRELEILLLICKGLTNFEIADKLFISKRTVDKHRANILEKTACKNTANLVVFAIKNGLVVI